MSEIQMLKNQLKIYEDEREFFCKKIKDLQEENLLLLAKLSSTTNDNIMSSSKNHYNHVDESMLV